MLIAVCAPPFLFTAFGVELVQSDEDWMEEPWLQQTI